jgi:hypothetical protein
MATTYTNNIRLQKPSTADRQWDVPLNANADSIDALAAVGGLAVTSMESPSLSLNCRISAGTYVTANGSSGSFAGLASLTLTANTTFYIWITDAGVAGSGTSFPATPHVRLAQAVTGPTSIVQIIDARMAYQSIGAATLFVSKAGDTVSGALQVVGPASGTPVLAVDPTAQTIGFFGVTAASQAARLNLLTDSTGGTASDVVANVGTAFSQATLNNNFASITAKVDALIAALKRHGLMSS